jgi:protein SCO1/2
MVRSTARRALPIVAAAAAAALGVAAYLAFDVRTPRAPEIAGYVLAKPRPLPNVELVDEHGARFTPDSFRGHWSLLYFGYTYCPDVCPLTLVELAGLKRHLEARSFDERVEYYLISVDPRRDTPERLREYVAYFDPAFHGLTGRREALAELAAATETVFEVPEGEHGDNYLVSHSSNVVLLDPDARVHAVLTPPHSSAALAEDFTAAVAAHRRSR